MDPLFKSLQFEKIGAMYALKILKCYFNLYHDIYNMPRVLPTTNYNQLYSEVNTR